MKPMQAKGESIQVKTYRCWTSLEERIPAWRKILNEDHNLSVFTAPEWLDSWWKTFGANRQLASFTFADASGKLRGIVPLYLSRVRDPIFGVLNYLRLVGDGSGDSKNLDFITPAGFEDACAHAFIRWLELQSDWQVCCLGPFSENSRTVRVLARQLELAKWPVMFGTSGNAAISLPATWQAYVESLGPEFRPLVTRYPRRLSNRYHVRIRRCENLNELWSSLDILFALHQKRWNRVNQPGSFSSETRREFYRDMAEAFLRRGWLELWLLELNATPVAAQFCFRYRDTAYVLQEGFDPDFAKDKVGYALRAAMLKYFIDSGTKRYDFLEGFSIHKQAWGAKPGRYLSVSFARPTYLGRNYITCNKLASVSKEWFRDHLPYKVWNALSWMKVHTSRPVGLGE
jgi:CelD/BcsL family acetyltransferase involved in cellulose biosynthesis